MPENYAIPFALDFAGFASAGPYRRVCSRHGREIVDESRGRSMVTPERNETAGYLRFVQQPMCERLAVDAVQGFLRDRPVPVQ